MDHISVALHNNEEQLIKKISVKFEVKKSNQGCAIKFGRKDVEPKIARVKKFGYGASIKYLYLKDWRSKRI